MTALAEDGDGNTFQQYVGLVGPMVTYLLPLLIANTAGRMVYGERGGVVATIAVMGVIVGTNIPMFLGAMIMGPIAAWVTKQMDKLWDGKIKPGFEMLVNNFSAGILGMVLAIIGFFVFGPVITGISTALGAAVAWLVSLNLLPLLSIIALAIRLTSSGPALYRQTRIGVGGREFQMIKFRSMVADADVQRTRLLELSEGNGVLFKMRKDPRVTRVGAVLRRFSLDELPQLFNVIRGDMSLVGPRPPLPEEVAAYSDDAIRRLRVKPGVTGLWQVSGRSDLNWEESLRLDLRYADNWSMALDLSILWRTVRAVVKGEGAY